METSTTAPDLTTEGSYELDDGPALLAVVVEIGETPTTKSAQADVSIVVSLVRQ